MSAGPPSAGNSTGHQTLDAEGDRLFGRPWVERARAEVEEELCLAELRHAEVLSQVEVAGCLEITQRAGSKLEHFEGLGCRPYASTSKRSVPAWRLWPYSTTRIIVSDPPRPRRRSRIGHEPVDKPGVVQGASALRVDGDDTSAAPGARARDRRRQVIQLFVFSNSWCGSFPRSCRGLIRLRCWVCRRSMYVCWWWLVIFRVSGSGIPGWHPRRR